MDELEIVARVAETITTAGLSLLWVYAERRDNKRQSKRIDRLIDKIAGTELSEDDDAE